MERARALAVVYWSSDIRTSSRGAADAPAVESDTANAMAPMRAEPPAGLGRGAAGLIQAASQFWKIWSGLTVMTLPHQFWVRALSISARVTQGAAPSPFRAENARCSPEAHWVE